jgi:hypothetical protein
MANELPHESRVRALSATNAVLGVWLIISPWVVGAPGQSVATSGIVAGVLTFIFAIVRFARKHTAVMSWANVLVGAWTVMSPWIFGEASGDFRTWNYVIVGVLIVLIEAYSLTSSSTQPNWRQSQSGRR